MIVIGVDGHKRTHTLVALDVVTGAGRGERTIHASDDGVLNALRFAVALDRDRVWAGEDCRHVTSRSGHSMPRAARPRAGRGIEWPSSPSPPADSPTPRSPTGSSSWSEQSSPTSTTPC